MVLSKRKAATATSNGFPSRKRIKAKVGKRAAVRANESSTDFRAVSVNVSHQTSSLASLRDVQALLSKTRHPSAQVRKSALLGILQHVQQEQQSYNNNDMSLWLASVSKCACTDLDESVRDVGYQMLQQVQVPHHYLPMVMAFVASAMVDLDSYIRFHACRVLHLLLLCNSNMKTTTPWKKQALVDTMKKDILPLFPKLLRDATIAKDAYENNSYQSKSRRESKQNKRKPKQATEDRLFVILQALVSFLKVVFEYSSSNEIYDTEPAIRDMGPQVEFLVGAKHKTNGIFVAPRNVVRRATRANAQQEIVKEHFMGVQQQTTTAQQQHQHLSWLILERLGDVFIELQQNQPQQAATNTHTSSSWDSQSLPRLLLLLESVQIIWKQSSNGGSPAQPQHQKLGLRILKTMLESFPILQGQHENGKEDMYSKVNALLSCIIIELGRVVDPTNSALPWKHPVVSFCLQELKDNNSTTTTNNSRPFMDTVATLLRGWNADENMGGGGVHFRAFQLVCDVYFPRDNNTTVPASLADGPKVVKLVLDIMKQQHQKDIFSEHQPSLDDPESQQQRPANDKKMKNRFGLLQRQILQYLPQYLLAWDTHHLLDTVLVWMYLLDRMRRHDPTAARAGQNRDANNILTFDMVETLQKDVGLCLFTKRTAKQTNRHSNSVLFERYPPHVQRLVIGVIGMLLQSSSPTIDRDGKRILLDGLVKVCSGNKRQVSVVKSHILDYVFDVLHTVRRSMSMQTYLEFVIGSIGIGQDGGTKRKSTTRDGSNENTISTAQQNNKDSIEITRTSSLANSAATTSVAVIDAGRNRDEALKRACRALCRCGSYDKVLSALVPVLSKWMKGPKGETSTLATMQPPETIRTKRAALILIASLVSNAFEENDTSSISESLPDLFQPLTTSICDMMPFILHHCDANVKAFHQLMRPVTVLMRCEPQILSAVFAESTRRILSNHNGRTQGTDELRTDSLNTNTTLLLRALVEVIQSPKVAIPAREQSLELTESCRTIENHLSTSNGGSQNGHLGGTLRTSLDLIVGVAPPQE